MNKEQLLKKLTALIDEAQRTRMYGLVEIQFSDGVPALLRKSTTEKLCTGEKSRAQDYSSRF
ncbi:MAG TPA: hypothetical protein VGK22_22575 [Candidatus Angelobacter sp.]